MSRLPLLCAVAFPAVEKTRRPPTASAVMAARGAIRVITRVLDIATTLSHYYDCPLAAQTSWIAGPTFGFSVERIQCPRISSRSALRREPLSARHVNRGSTRIVAAVFARP